MVRVLCLVALLAFPSVALADPCEAIPLKGRLPAYLAKGKAFSGPVTYVGDGDLLCVAVGRPDDGRQWVEVRVEDFYAPELRAPGGEAAKRALQRIAQGKHAVCTSAGRKSYDRVIATCRVGGVSVAEAMRAMGVMEGGRGR
jgi:endonuclease YncB( thermonuclease family)